MKATKLDFFEDSRFIPRTLDCVTEHRTFLTTAGKKKYLFLSI